MATIGNKREFFGAVADAAGRGPLGHFLLQNVTRFPKLKELGVDLVNFLAEVDSVPSA